MNKPNFWWQIYTALGFKDITQKCLAWNEALVRPESQPTGPLAMALKDAYVKDFFRCFEHSRKAGHTEGNVFYTTVSYVHKFISETMSHRQISNIIDKFAKVGIFKKSSSSHKFNKNMPAIHCLKIELNTEWLAEQSCNQGAKNEPTSLKDSYVSPTSRANKTQQIGEIFEKMRKSNDSKRQ